MVVYVGKPNIHKSNMMALVAMDASFTSAPNLQYPPLAPNNIVVQEF